MYDDSSDEIIQPRRSTRKRIKDTKEDPIFEIVEEPKSIRNKLKRQNTNKLESLFEESEQNESYNSVESELDYEIDDELFKAIFGNGTEYKIEKYVHKKKEDEVKKHLEIIEFTDEEIIKYVKLKYEVNEEVIIALKKGINVNYISFYMNHNLNIHKLYEILDHIKKYENYLNIVNKCKEYNEDFNYKEINTVNHAINQLEYLKYKIKDTQGIIGTKILKPEEFIKNLETKSLKYITKEGEYNFEEDLIKDYATKISKSPIFYKFYKKEGESKIMELTKYLNIFQYSNCLEIIKRAIKQIPIKKYPNLKEKIFNEIFYAILNTSYCKLQNNEKCCIFTDFDNSVELKIIDYKYNSISKMFYNKIFIKEINDFLNKHNPKFILFIGDSRNTKLAFDDIKKNNSNFTMFFFYSKYFDLKKLSIKSIIKLVTVPEIEYLKQINQILNYFKQKINTIPVLQLKEIILNAILTTISFCGLEYKNIEDPEIFNHLHNCFPKNFKYKNVNCKTINEYKDILSLNDSEFRNFSTFFRIYNSKIEELDSKIIHPDFHFLTKNLLNKINSFDKKIILDFYETNKNELTEIEKKLIALLLFNRPKFKGATDKQVFKLLVNFNMKYLNTKHKLNIKGSNTSYSYGVLEIEGKKYNISIPQKLEGNNLIEINSINYKELTILGEKIILQDFSSFINNPLFIKHLNFKAAKERLLNLNLNIIIIKDEILDKINILCKIGKNSIKTFKINSPENFKVDDEIYANFKEFRTEFLEKFLENIKKIYKTKNVYTEKAEILKFFKSSENKFCFYLTPEKDYDMLLFKDNIKNKYPVVIGRYIYCKSGQYTEIEDLLTAI